MITRRHPIKRSTTPIRRVSTRRAVQLREYSKLRAKFLAEHPFCQIAVELSGLAESVVIQREGRHCDWTAPRGQRVRDVPRSVEIHHRAGRTGEKLNDVSKWLAVCRGNHDWCHQFPSEARAREWLL